MLHRLRRYDFLIKHQLYLRILPVAVLAVLAVGLFSGRLLTNRAVRTYLEQRRDEDRSSLREISDRIKVRSLAVEALKDEMNAAGTGDASIFFDEVLDGNGVCGVSLVPAWPYGERPSEYDMVLEPGLRSPATAATLSAWHRNQLAHFCELRWIDFLAREAWDDGPVQILIDAHHSLWVFAPVSLTVNTDDGPAVSSAGYGAESVSVLPVLVREKDYWTRPASSDGRESWNKSLTMLFLDLDYLTQDVVVDRGRPGDLTLLVDHDGRVLQALSDSTSRGTMPSGFAVEMFPSTEAREIADFITESGDGFNHTYVGRKWRPLILTAARRPGIPFTLVSVLPIAGVHGGLVLYTAIVILMAVIALLGSVLAITNVGEALSGRLGAMSSHMEEVARGNYARKMSAGKDDEVGRLVDYFNQMTLSLGEAHDEVREKTNRLSKALETQRRLDKAKDDFLTLISHEVRTPLTSIMGGVEFLRGIDRIASPAQVEILNSLNLLEIGKIIADNGQRLQEFMNDALMMTALQSSDSQVQFEAQQLGDLCLLVLSSLQDPIADKDLRIDMELSLKDSWIAYCDRELIVIALDKLLHNAVQHNVSGGRVRIREARLVPKVLQSQDNWLPPPMPDKEDLPSFVADRVVGLGWRTMEIFNTGPAIPEHKQEGLFRKFELVGKIEHHQKSSGLSLPIVQAVLENHGGGVAVESFEGTGSFFYLTLPVLELRPAPAGQTSGDEVGQGVGGAARDEEVGVAGDPAGLCVELQNVGAGLSGDGDEPGGGIHVT